MIKMSRGPRRGATAHDENQSSRERIAMTTRLAVSFLAAAALAGLGFATTAQAQQQAMTFFVTSAGSGNGANLGGIAGADAHCQSLAKAAGSTLTNWKAYLST